MSGSPTSLYKKLCSSSKPKRKRKKLRKLPFLLLEVLIAFALVALCALPLIWPHTYILRAQKEFLSEIALDHFVNLHYADITEKLYKNEIDWEVIEEGRILPITTSLPYKGTFTFEEKKHKPKNDNPYTLYLYKLMYAFTPKGSPIATPLTYTYNIFIIRDLPAELVDVDEEDEEEEE